MQDVPHPPKPHYYFVKNLPSSIASIVKFPKKGPKDPSYQELACTQEDKDKIYEIITTVAETGKLSLLVKRGHLKALGAEINHVHPLKFLSTIFTHPYLRSCMWEIFDDYFKRKEFMEGLGPSLHREADRGKLAQHIEPFAAEVGVSAEMVRPHFESREWEELVRFLIHNLGVAGEK